MSTTTCQFVRTGNPVSITWCAPDNIMITCSCSRKGRDVNCLTEEGMHGRFYRIHATVAVDTTYNPDNSCQSTSCGLSISKHTL